MNLRFRHALNGMALGSGVISLPSLAAQQTSDNAPIISGTSEPDQPLDSIVPEAGLLISVVLIALVLITRRINRQD